MRLYFRTVLAVVIVCVLCIADLEGKGRGGGKGRGHGSTRRSHISRRPVRGHNQPGRRFDESGRRFRDSERVKPQKVTGKQHALDMQRRNAERNLKHRQDTAQRLRDISAQNGNEQLLDTADKMDQNAQQQYDKRIEKINAFQDPSQNLSPDLSQDLSPDHHAGEPIAP